MSSQEQAPQPDKRAEIEAIINHPLFQIACMVEVERQRIAQYLSRSRGRVLQFRQACSTQVMAKELADGNVSFVNNIARILESPIITHKYYYETMYEKFLQINPQGLQEFLETRPELQINSEHTSDRKLQEFYKTCSYLRLSKPDQKLAQELHLVDDLDLTVLEQSE
jgi:hypothetical protein